MMQRKWQPMFSPEDEGGGGASADKIAALENRLAQMSSNLAKVVDNQRGAQQRSQFGEAEAQITKRIAEAEAAEAAAETALATAFDNGEGADVAKAQRKMTETTAARLEAQADHRAYKAQVIEAEKRQGGGGSGAVDTSNLNQWKQKHAAWYGVDSDMTKAAHKVDQQIRAAGVLPTGSAEYYSAIDREMKRLYPDRIGGGAPVVAGEGQGKQGSVSQTRFDKGVIAGWRRMGINVDDPKTLDRMGKNREVLVQKGILPSVPVTGSVRTA